MRHETKILGTLALLGLAGSALAWPASGCANSASDCALLGLPDGCSTGDGGATTTSSSTGGTTNTGGTGGTGTGGTGTGGTGTGGTGTGGTGTGGTGTGGTGTGGTGTGGSPPSYLPVCARKVWGGPSDQAVLGMSGGVQGTFIGGDFHGVLDVGVGPMTAAASGSTFLARLDTNLTPTWSKSFAATFHALASDASGNVFVAGGLTGPAVFECGTLDIANGDNFYLAKLDVTGKCIYAKSFKASVSRVSLEVAAGGALVLAGSVTGTTAFGSPIVAHGGEDILVASFDTDGNVVNVRSFGDTGDDGAVGLALDASGQIYVTGTFQGSVDFVAGNGPLDSQGHVGVFLTAFNASLGASWAKQLVSANDQSAAGIVTLPVGVAIGGTFSGDVSFGATKITSTNEALFVARVGSTGTLTRMDKVDNVAAGDVTAMAASSADDVIVAGSQAAGLFAARVRASGMVDFQSVASGMGSRHRATGAVLASTSEVLLGGFFDGSLVATSTDTLTSGGGDDALVLKLCLP